MSTVITRRVCGTGNTSFRVEPRVLYPRKRVDGPRCPDGTLVSGSLLTYGPFVTHGSRSCPRSTFVSGLLKKGGLFLSSGHGGSESQSGGLVESVLIHTFCPSIQWKSRVSSFFTNEVDCYHSCFIFETTFSQFSLKRVPE